MLNSSCCRNHVNEPARAVVQRKQTLSPCQAGGQEATSSANFPVENNPDQLEHLPAFRHCNLKFEILCKRTRLRYFCRLKRHSHLRGRQNSSNPAKDSIFRAGNLFPTVHSLEDSKQKFTTDFWLQRYYCSYCGVREGGGTWGWRCKAQQPITNNQIYRKLNYQ